LSASGAASVVTSTEAGSGEATSARVSRDTSVAHMERRSEELNTSEMIDAFTALDVDGDGGDSDVEGEEIDCHSEAADKALLERADNNELFHVEHITAGDIAMVIGKKEVMTTADTEAILANLPHQKPDDWERPAKKDVRPGKEPDFEDLDNPGNWSDFIFRPVYTKVGVGARAEYHYMRHELPTGCTPVPPIVGESRMSGDWKFYYQGWESTNRHCHRAGATAENLFPKERESTLDGSILKKLGMNAERVNGVGGSNMPDPLFFYQLLLPMCDPSMSGVERDPRKPFYTKVSQFSNLYKYQTGIGNGYGHDIPEVQMPEIVRFDGCVYRDGIRGGGDGALYRRWLKGSACEDVHVMNALSLHRFHQIKRIIKLNNNDSESCKRSSPEYDPSHKFDMIYDTIVANIIALTEKGELDLTGDETTYAFQGFGERGSAIIARVLGKPGVTKGGQIFLISARGRVRPYFYRHRHKLTETWPPEFKAQGPCEVKAAIDHLDEMVVGKPGDKKKIFPKEPHICLDNYFSGEKVLKYAGDKGFGLLVTTRRDRLPKGIKGHYLHKQKTNVTVRSKAARFIPPVIAVKSSLAYDIVHTSFQSTSSCNIMSVNSFNSNKNFIEARSRGRKDSKRHYAIEQNMARLLYLNSYGRIDSIDHLIKNCKVKYVSWKYWHSAMNHAKSLAIVAAFDIYKEVCEGHIDPTWKVDDPIDRYTFQDLLSKQMCMYDPTMKLYPGDEKLRACTQLSKKKRKIVVSPDRIDGGDGSGEITYAQWRQIKRTKRVCNNLMKYDTHIHSIVPHKSGAKCAVCGKMSYKKCGLCGVVLHHLDTKGANAGMNCHIKWHADHYIGLCYQDRNLVGKTKTTWRKWTQRTVKENGERIEGFKRRENRHV
jgi:hypothetical protein